MNERRPDHDVADDAADSDQSSPAAADAKPVKRHSKAASPDAQDGDGSRGGFGQKVKHWLIIGAVLLVLVLIVMFIWNSFLPRWWAQTISQMTGGTFSGGVGWGLAYGFLFTFLPLMILGLAIGKKWKNFATRVVFAIIAIILAIPNLLTLSVSLASGRANEIARVTFDTNAPWFRGATLIGAIIAAILAVIIWVLGYIRRRRGRELKEIKQNGK